MRYLIYIFLLFSLSGYGQSKMLLASIQQAAGGCTPDANEKHTSANAASDPNCNEANAVTGWTDVGAGSVTSTSGAISGGAGDYKLQFNASSGSGGEYATYSFTAVSGNTYKVTAIAQVIGGPGTNSKWQSWQGVTSFSAQNFTSTPTNLDVEVEANATTVSIRIYVGTDATNIVAWDNLSIIDLGVL